MENTALGSHSLSTTVSSFVLFATKHRYILLLYPGSALCFHVTDHHIKHGHFGAQRASFYLLVSDKTAIFPFIHFHTSIPCYAATQTLTHPKRSALLYTHTFSLVINNILMAMLCSLTHSQPIHQRVQLAYDHNKYAQDECSAAGRNDPGFVNRRTDVIRNSTILKKQYFLPVKNLLGSEES